jgi:hypothetical protein
MLDVRTCDCQYSENCHTLRQHFQALYRERDPNIKVSDCSFHRLFVQHRKGEDIGASTDDSEDLRG